MQSPCRTNGRMADLDLVECDSVYRSKIAASATVLA
jgi:hypothetical protein